MDPISAAIGAGGSLISNLLGNVFQNDRQQQAQQFAIQQAATAESYFRTNRQTAYQDTVGDMKAAGLNPILAYQQGATPGAMGIAPSPVMAPANRLDVGSAVQAGMAMATQKQQLDNLQATKNLTEAQTQKTNAEALTEKNRPENVAASTEQMKNDAQRLQAATGYTWAQLEKAQLEVMESKNIQQFAMGNPNLFRALVVGAYGMGKGGEMLAPFKDLLEGWISGAKNNSAGSTNMPRPTQGGNSAKNLGNVSGVEYGPITHPTPNTYKQSQPGWEPAPAKQGGWFTDRWKGMTE